MARKSVKKKVRSNDEPKNERNAQPIWEIAAEIRATIPKEEWEKLPRDLSINFEHYLYGVPKQK